MDFLEAMQARHSVRSYEPRPIEGETLARLEQAVADCNRESGLNIQLVKNEPKAFDSRMAHYGKFSGVTNYFALVGKKGPKLEETCGYYGEKLVLLAQTLGLSTCWVALTYKKIPEAFSVAPGEKLAIVIAVGYGATAGAAHKSKEAAAVSNLSADSPDWFRRGVAASLLAPTAMNQQKFKLTLQDGRVAAKAGTGFYTKIDLGIVKCHFELGSCKNRDVWME